MRVLSFAFLAACYVREPQQAQACSPGYTWNGHLCVTRVDTSCPAGTSFVDGRGCVAQVAQDAPPPQPTATMATYQQQPYQPPPPQGQTCTPPMQWNGRACMMPRAEWVRQMNAALPSKICTLPIFQRCFRATRPECERIVASLSDACMAERNLPPLFDDARGEREGEAVGRCIGEAYQQNMKARGRVASTPECQN